MRRFTLSGLCRAGQEDNVDGMGEEDSMQTPCH